SILFLGEAGHTRLGMSHVFQKGQNRYRYNIRDKMEYNILKEKKPYNMPICLHIGSQEFCTTSLLSAFQAITISPSNSKWARLKTKSSTWILPSLFFFWIINMVVYIHVILSLEANRNFTIVGFGYSHAYCQTKKLKNYYPGAFTSVLVIRDVLFVAPMIWTSIYMVNLLYRHHRRAQHLHSPSLSAQPSPENKATHTILWLVSCFVFFYCSDNFVTFYLYYKSQKSPRLDRVAGIISSCYPTICPFVLMKNNKMISKYTSSFSKLRFTFFSRSIQ
ncbi:vomeronasal type-1 receptor 94-like, partial [Tupaia chinensis]|uniref:vomeronasal type-1 receptor 94-like n=1 Tax=Tupaia chinensis TaxID=246437 RepID=UPI000703C9F6